MPTYTYSLLIGATCLTLGSACSRQAPSDISEPLAAPVQQAIRIGVDNVERTAEDEDRLWLPPLESQLADNDVPLIDIPELVEQARQQAHAALEANQAELLQEAQDQLQAVQSAIYGLAVRMRDEWSMMQYQGFLTKLRYHEILDLDRSISRRQSYLENQAWLWDGPPTALEH